ncbi:MAG: alpha/beta fold hydrolase [Halieaceae bacterium]|jgi:acetyl esterase/lipase|nr:alpha/beta fold hydrolase [Halieaceae bacterium]
MRRNSHPKPSAPRPGITVWGLRLAFAATALLAGCRAGPAPTPHYHYPAALEQVSFDEVMALPWRPADQRVSYGPAPQQFAELWLPPGQDDVPVVVFIHGGCWLNAFGIDHSRPLATALAQRGYAVWSIEYRRLGDSGGGWPGTKEDVVAAIARLDALQHPRLRLDRMVIVGHSAGGHLALLAAAHPLQHPPTAVLGLAAIVDLKAYAAGAGSCNKAAAAFIESGTTSATTHTLPPANPALSPAPANTLLLEGTEDAIVPPQTAVITGVGASAAAAWAPQWQQAGAGHFDWVHPGTPAWQTLMETLAQALP